MQSQRYGDLRARINVLKRRLPRVNPIGQYSARQIDATLAFRLLSHAELESCLEDLASVTTRKAIGSFVNQGDVTLPLAALCAAYGGRANVKGYGRGDVIASVAQAAAKRHLASLNRNHGVKESNLIRLFQPLGVDLSALDATWVANMNSFGSSRGAAAHRSIGSQRLPDPLTERQTVTAVVDGLAQLDSWLLSV